jgi:zinc D-Ala-D-Ala carboxypeptidase
VGKKWLITALCLTMLFAWDCAYAQELEHGNSVSWTYPVSLTELQKEYIRLANQDNLLPADYIPKNLVKIKVKKTSSSAIQMCDFVSDALDAMFAAASLDGETLYAHSGYRSYKTQNTMYKNRLEQNNGVDDGVVAYPGASDHQTGLGIDIISKDWIGKKFNSEFAQTSEAQWMAAHCAEYGFVIRYPEGKEDITKIIYEPWHLRYVGLEAAQYMMSNGLTLEEFTVEWLKALNDFQGNGGDTNQTLEQSQSLEQNQNAEQGQTGEQDQTSKQDQTIGQNPITGQSQLPQGPVILEEVGADGDPEVTLFH